jgi:hypothetical protein
MNSVSTGNSSPVSASMIIFFFVVIVFYFCYKIILKDVSYDWENKRCTPKYIFYSGFLISPTGDPLKDTYQNFIQCTDPTKTPTEGESKFKVVFDTANTITNTANAIMNYSNDIMNESTRIKDESKNRISSMKNKTNILNTSMNQLYNYQLKLFTILKIYFERIFLILDTLSYYITDITLYSLHKLKSNLAYKGEQLTSFIDNNIRQYENIYDGDITSALADLKKIKGKAPSTDTRDEDYINFVSNINKAKDKYKELSEAILQFDKLNMGKLAEIDTICNQLQTKNIKYTSIFPFLEDKIIRPGNYQSNDVV